MNLKGTICASIFFIALLLINACNDPTDIGNGFIADDDFLFTHFTDTLTVKAYLEVDDSIVTNNSSTFLIGATTDPVFGRSQASLYFQVKMEGNNLALSVPDDETPIYDSLVLSLDYAGSSTSTIYGDDIFNYLQEYRIDRLDENLPFLEQEFTDDDTTNIVKKYYATDEVLVSDYLGNYFFHHDIFNTIDLGEEGIADPQLRFKLPDFLGLEIFNDLQNNPTLFENDSTFTEYFNGFRIQPGNNATAIAFFNMTSSFTKMTLYYHYNVVDDETGSVTEVSQLTNFPVKTSSNENNSVIFNNYQHNYNSTEIETVLNSTDQQLTDLGYMQSMIGLNMRLQIPYLQNLGNILVNRANFEITEFNDGYIEPLVDTLYPPPILLAYRVAPETDEEGFANTDYDIFNLLEEDTDTAGNIIHKYNVFLNYAIQNEILNGTYEKEYVVSIPAKSISASRVKVYGPTHNEFPLKLNLYYTKVD